MMSNSNYSIGLQRVKPVHTAYCGLHNLAKKLVLGTRRKWPRCLPPETETLTIFLETRRWYVSRRRDRDYNPVLGQ